MPRLSGFAGPGLLALAALAALVVTLAVVPDVDPIGPTLGMLVAALGAAVCAGAILVAGLQAPAASGAAVRALRLATGGAIAWTAGALVVAALTVRVEWAITAAVAATALVLCAAARHPGPLAAVAAAALLLPALVAGHELAPGLLAGASASSLVVVASVVFSAGAGVSLARAVAPRDPDASRGSTAIAAVAIAVQGAGIGVLVALVQLAEDAGAVDLDTATPAEYLTGLPLPPPLSVASALGEWRVDAIALALIVIGGILSIRGARRLRRRDAWSALRAVPFVLAFVVLLWATCGAPVVYAPTLFSAHAIRLALLLAVVPALLALAAAGRLFAAAFDARTDGTRGVREWGAALAGTRTFAVVTHPFLLAALAAALPWVATFTPLLRASVERPVVGGALDAVALLIGCGLVAALTGRTPVAPSRPATRVALSLVVIASWGCLAVVLALGSGLLAADWFGAMGRDADWDVVADQRVGGAVAWALGSAALLPALGRAIVDGVRGGGRRDPETGAGAGRAELDAYDAILARRGAAESAQ